MTTTADDAPALAREAPGGAAVLAESEIFLDAAEAGEYSDVPADTLELLRAVDLGPPSCTVDGRRVYRLTDLDEWRAGDAFARDIGRGVGLVTDAPAQLARAFVVPAQITRSSGAREGVARVA